MTESVAVRPTCQEQQEANNSLEDIATEIEPLIARENKEQLVTNSSFSANGLAGHFKDLVGHTSYISAVEFSKDGNLLASGGRDTIIRLWPITNLISINDGETSIIPIEMEKRHGKSICCLAFSPDNNQIFSGCADENIFIHNVET